MNIESAPLEVGQRMVARFWRWTPADLAKNARMAFSDDMADGLGPTVYVVSVFAKRRRDGETVPEFVARACAELRGERNVPWVALVPESDLVAAGFRIELSEPPVDHYDIPVGLNEETLRVEELSAVFSLYERRKVPK